MSSTTLRVYTDGGSRGNPGPAAIGVVGFLGETQVFSHKEHIGEDTNNGAEYQAFYASLNMVRHHLKTHDVQAIEWYLDSKLVVEQLCQRWKVKDSKIRTWWRRCIDLLHTIKTPYSITHVPRGNNALADSLVNQALDEKMLETVG